MGPQTNNKIGFPDSQGLKNLKCSHLYPSAATAAGTGFLTATRLEVGVVELAGGAKLAVAKAIVEGAGGLAGAQRQPGMV